MQSTRRDDLVKFEELSSVPLQVVRASAEQGSVIAQAELGRRLARRNKRKEALALFRSAARGGDPELQMELGTVLCWDHGAYREGLRWIRKAAQQGLVGAQYFLGAELATGENVRKNLPEAARWYRRAAKQHHGEAQYNLGLMYWFGEGVPRSVRTAHRWVERAAAQGDLLALRALAEAYETGNMGYGKNRVKAQYWRRRYDRANEAVLTRKHSSRR